MEGLPCIPEVVIMHVMIRSRQEMKRQDGEVTDRLASSCESDRLFCRDTAYETRAQSTKHQEGSVYNE